MSYALISGEVIPAVTGGVFSFERVLTAAEDAALENSVISIIASYIINDLLLMTSPSDMDDWPLYLSSMPDGADVETNCGAVYDTSGILDGKMVDGEVIQHPGIQLRIRSDDYETGFAKIESIALALDDTFREVITIGAISYLLKSMSRTTPIVPLGSERGTKRRFLFTVNFLCTLKRIVT